MADNKKKANGEAATMSENQKKTNGEAPPPTISKGSRFAGKFSRLINLCTEMQKDAAGALDYEKTVDENSRLKKALEQRDGEVVSLRAEVEQLKKLRVRDLDDFGMRFSDYNSKLKDVESTKETLDITQGKLNEANNKIKTLKIEKTQLEKKAREREALLEETTEELDGSKFRVQGLEGQLKGAQNKISSYGEGRLVKKDAEQMYASPPQHQQRESFANISQGRGFPGLCRQVPSGRHGVLPWLRSTTCMSLVAKIGSVHRLTSS